MQHCWMLHVASVNCMHTLLEVVVQSLKSVKILATWKPMQQLPKLLGQQLYSLTIKLRNYANFCPLWAPVPALKIRIHHLPPVVSGGFTSYHGGAVSIQLSCHQKNLEFYQAKKYYFLSVTYRSVTMFNKAYMCPLNPSSCIHTEKTEMYTHNLSLCQINNYYF